MKKIILTSLFSVFLIWNCSEIQDWSDPKDSVPPGKISDVKIENLHGGVKITYKLPGDSDILGVKAVCPVKDEILESFSSAYRDTIEISGFPDTEERTVCLICIDKSRNESEPVEVKINPLTPPVEMVKSSITMAPTFGGVFVKWVNEMNAEISISIYTADSTGIMNLNYAHYSKLTQGSYSFRGYDNTTRQFRFQIRDKWGNFSVVDTVLTPLFEEEIVSRDEYNILKWNRYGISDGSWKWRGDLGSDTSWPISMDGILIGLSSYWSSASNYIYLYDPSFPTTQGVLPMYVTVDLGEEVTLSRHKIWMRGRNPNDAYLLSSHRYYQQGAPRYYEIWGSNNPPKEPGDFASIGESLVYWTDWSEIGGADSWKNDWVKLLDCEMIPPSGALTTPELTVDDIIYADNGVEFQVTPELTSEKVRYIRFVFKECWDKARINLHIQEIKFYGAYIK